MNIQHNSIRNRATFPPKSRQTHQTTQQIPKPSIKPSITWPTPIPPQAPPTSPESPLSPTQTLSLASVPQIQPKFTPLYLPKPSPIPPQPANRLLSTLRTIAAMTTLFATWYASNIYFNILNKQALTLLPQPLLATWIHLFVSSCLGSLLWLTRIRTPPRLSRNLLTTTFPLATLHLAGFYTTNASLGRVLVSLTHTVKSLEPLFTVLLSWFMLGSRPAKRVVASLLPIVFGVIVASATDLSFNWFGFSMAMASNLAFQARNVLSKRMMRGDSETAPPKPESETQPLKSSSSIPRSHGRSTSSHSTKSQALSSAETDSPESGALDDVNIFVIMSATACILLTPFVLLKLPEVFAVVAAEGNTVGAASEALLKTVLAGVMRFGDVLASFMILQQLSPVSHSVGNCVKRVVVIAASMLFFQTTPSTANAVGTGMALGGVALYAFAKNSRKSKDDKEVEAGDVTQCPTDAKLQIQEAPVSL